MNKADCVTEKWSIRTIGLIILPISLILALIGFVLVPIVGFFFALPFLVLSLFFIAAPESKACKLILKK